MATGVRWCLLGRSPCKDRMKPLGSRSENYLTFTVHSLLLIECILGMLAALSDFSTKGIFCGPEVLENNFPAMTAGQVGPEDIITTVVIATDEGNALVATALIQKSLPTDKQTQTFG